jgi:ankyrin repeat protein
MLNDLATQIIENESWKVDSSTKGRLPLIDSLLSNNYVIADMIADKYSSTSTSLSGLIYEKESILTWAIRSNSYNITCWLIDKIAKDYVKVNGDHPLAIAIESGYDHLALLLIDKGVDLFYDQRMEFENISLTDKSDSRIEKPRHMSIRDLLIDEDDFTLDIDEDDFTLDSVIVANYNAPHSRNDDIGRSPLYIAIKYHQYHIASLLIEKGVDIDGKLLIMALSEKMDYVASLLINKNVALDVKDDRDRSPLILATKNKLIDSFYCLLEKNCDIDIRDSLGNTAFDYADGVFRNILLRKSSENTKYQLAQVNNHIIATIDDCEFLVDTGSPTSFCTSGRISLMGQHSKVAKDFMGLTGETLSKSINYPVSGLIGTDILAKYHIVFDLPNAQLLVSEEAIELTGNSIELQSFMGIPILAVTVQAEHLLFFFDTGAPVSYWQSEELSQYLQLCLYKDFYPMIGDFETELYLAKFTIGTEAYELKTGVLPELLAITLAMADTVGIIGNEILLQHKVGYFPLTSKLVIQ